MKLFHRDLAMFRSMRLALALAGILLFPWSCNTRPSGKRIVRIGLVYIGPHELINQIVAGFKEGVAESLGNQGFEIVERHANGDKTQISSTVNATIASNLDVIATITTPVSQVALKNAPKTLPLVFVGVTDPLGAGLVKSMDKPELCTGVSDLAPLKAMLSLVRTVTPNVRKVGFPYSPEEQPALYSLSVLKSEGPRMGFTVDARPVTSRDELATVVRELARGNDAILVGADNAMFEAAPNIAKIALDNRKPFFAADSSSVKAGAIGGVTVDYRQVGLAGGKIAVRVIKGEQAGSIPVMVMTQGATELNRTAINSLGLTVSDSVWKSAKTQYQ